MGERKRIENLSGYRSVFWDITDLTHIDLDDRKEYLIERVLEFGETDHTAWLLERYSLEDIKAILNNSKTMKVHVKEFWEKVLSGL